MVAGAGVGMVGGGVGMVGVGGGVVGGGSTKPKRQKKGLRLLKSKIFGRHKNKAPSNATSGIESASTTAYVPSIVVDGPADTPEENSASHLRQSFLRLYASVSFCPVNLAISINILHCYPSIV